MRADEERGAAPLCDGSAGVRSDRCAACRVVQQHELAGRARHARRAEARVALVARGERAAEAAVGAALAEQALLLEEREDALRSGKRWGGRGWSRW